MNYQAQTQAQTTETHPFDPPECPFCEGRVEEVWGSEKSTLSFDRRDGTYGEEPTACEVLCMCPRCKRFLPRDTFPEGPLNHRRDS